MAESASPSGLRPGPPLEGSYEPAASKSLAQRALLLAGLSKGVTRIGRFSREASGQDVQAALVLIEACGAHVDLLGTTGLRIAGREPDPLQGWSLSPRLDAGESGTLARLATAVVSFSGERARTVELTGRGTLLARTSPPLFAALRRAGADLEHVGVQDGWPVRVRPRAPPAVVELEHPVSSQEVSALLIALAARPQSARLQVSGTIPSRPYLGMTLALLRRFGVRVEPVVTPEGELFMVQGPLVPPEDAYELEPDASSAAVVAAAACITGGGVKILGLDRDSLQGDVRIAEHLAHFGCSQFSTQGSLVVAGAPTRGASLDLAGEPDLAPVLAAVGATVALRAQANPWPRNTTTVLSGLATLQRKESARLDVLAQGMREVGLTIETGPAYLRIAAGPPGPTGDAKPVQLDPAGDHRMAFAFALLGLVRDFVELRDAGCVAKSWPNFWRDLERLGARVMLRGS